MVIQTASIELNTRGENDIINITDEIDQLIRRANISEGSVLIFVPGATGAISTIEYEPGLIRDFPEIMETLIPQEKPYHHNQTWHDGNGHSHIRATLIGPSLTVPISSGRPVLGTWQQIVFLEFDNKPHRRNLFVQLTGEP